jgi:uncharacterized protein with PIN domain
MNAKEHIHVFPKEHIVEESANRCPECKTYYRTFQGGSQSIVEAQCSACGRFFTIYRCVHCKRPFATGTMGRGTDIESRCTSPKCKGLFTETKVL